MQLLLLLLHYPAIWSSRGQVYAAAAAVVRVLQVQVLAVPLTSWCSMRCAASLIGVDGFTEMTLSWPDIASDTCSSSSSSNGVKIAQSGGRQ
jgi:hypothetical protein